MGLFHSRSQEWPEETSGKKKIGETETPIKARPVRVYDGDTVWFDVKTKDLFPQKRVQIKVRAIGFDAPEINPIGKSKAEKAYESKIAKKVKDRVEVMLKRAKKTEVKFCGLDCYGRFLGDIYLDGEKMSDFILDNGISKPYGGRLRRDPYTHEELLIIEKNLEKTK